MKKRVLIAAFALSVLFVSSKAYAYWMNQLHFSMGIPVSYDIKISVMTQEKREAENKIRHAQKEIIINKEEVPLAVPDDETKESSQIIVESPQAPQLVEQEYSFMPTSISEEQQQQERDLFAFTYNEGN